MHVIVADDNFDIVLLTVRADAPLICRIRRCKRNGDDAYLELEYNGQNYELVSEFPVGQSCHPVLVVLKLPPPASTVDRSEGWKQSRLHIRTQKDRCSTSAHVATQFLGEEPQGHGTHMTSHLP